MFFPTIALLGRAAKSGQIGVAEMTRQDDGNASLERRISRGGVVKFPQRVEFPYIADEHATRIDRLPRG